MLRFFSDGDGTLLMRLLLKRCRTPSILIKNSPPTGKCIGRHRHGFALKLIVTIRASLYDSFDFYFAPWTLFGRGTNRQIHAGGYEDTPEDDEKVFYSGEHAAESSEVSRFKFRYTTRQHE